jgi:hypothetical protein
VSRLLCALVGAAVLPACFASAAPAASKVLLLPVPAAGDVTVAHVTFTVKGRATGALRAPRVAGAGALGPGLTVVGGLRRGARPRTLLATAIVVRRQSGEAGVSGVSVQVRLPRGARFGRFVQRHIVASVDGSGKRPPYCAALPASFTYIAANPLAGTTFGFDARSIAKYASQLGCKAFPQRAAFLSALDSESGGEGGGGRPGSGVSEEEGSPEYQPPQPTTSETLTATGSVTRDPTDPRRFSYSISFNEPVHAFTVAANPSTIHCPTATYAAWYPTCGPDSLQPGNGLTCTQAAGSYVYEFGCEVATDEEGRHTGAPLPAGAVVNGVFTTDPERPAPTFSSVEVTGRRDDTGQGTVSRPTTIGVS